MANRAYAVWIPGLSCLALITGCASGGGRELYEGVRFYERQAVPALEERWSGGWNEIPMFVVMEGDYANGVRGPRALALRDAILGRRPGRQDLFRIVLMGDLVGDTLGSVLWQPPVFAARECVMFDVEPGEPGRPACTRQEVTTREAWQPEPMLRTAWEEGGNVVLFVGEEYSGTFRGLRGYVLRCPDRGDGPVCR